MTTAISPRSNLELDQLDLHIVGLPELPPLLRHCAGDYCNTAQAMAEEGIDVSAQTPKVVTAEAVRASDVVVTMGCGDARPVFSGKRYEDWELDDPAGQGIGTVRRFVMTSQPA